MNEDGLVLANGAQSETKSSKFLSHVTRGFGGGYVSVLRTSLIQRAPRGVKYHELLINNSLDDILESDATKFEEFATMARGSEETFFWGKGDVFLVADLVIIDQPFDTVVPGFKDVVPRWNSLDGTTKEWYLPRFEFIDEYLHDDGAILILMPMGLSHKLMHWVLKYKLKTKCKWQVHQSKPLTHPAYENMMTFNFSAVLLVKTGRLRDKQWDRLPYHSSSIPIHCWPTHLRIQSSILHLLTMWRNQLWMTAVTSGVGRMRSPMYFSKF